MRDTRPADEIPCVCGDQRGEHAAPTSSLEPDDWGECMVLGGCMEADGEVCRSYRPAPPEGDDGPARYAKCPECGQTRRAERDDAGRDVFERHGDPFAPCTGSGWLIEDEDRVGGRWPRD